MPLVAWPHCSCPPDPVRDPSARERSGLPAPTPPKRNRGKVTIQFSTSKARVDRLRRSADSLARTVRGRRLDATLITTELSKNHTRDDSFPSRHSDRLAPAG